MGTGNACTSCLPHRGQYPAINNIFYRLITREKRVKRVERQHQVIDHHVIFHLQECL